MIYIVVITAAVVFGISNLENGSFVIYFIIALVAAAVLSVRNRRRARTLDRDP